MPEKGTVETHSLVYPTKMVAGAFDYGAGVTPSAIGCVMWSVYTNAIFWLNK